MSNSVRRGGYTLVELLASLTVLLVMGMSAAKLLTTVTQIGLGANDRKASIAMIEKLSSDFRTDVGQAEAITIGQDADTIELVMDQSTIRYKFDEATRSINRSQEESQQGTKRNESYKLTDRCQPQFVSDDDLVTLRLTPEGVSNPWAIEAPRP